MLDGGSVEELEAEMRRAAQARPERPAPEGPVRSIEALTALRPAEATPCPPELRGLYDRSCAAETAKHSHSSFGSPMRSAHTSGGGSLLSTPPRGAPLTGRLSTSPRAGACGAMGASSPLTANSAMAQPGHMMLPPSMHAQGAARITVGIGASESTSELERILGQMAVAGSPPTAAALTQGACEPRAVGSGPWARHYRSPPLSSQQPTSGSCAIPGSALPPGMQQQQPQRSVWGAATRPPLYGTGVVGAMGAGAGASAVPTPAPGNLSAWFGSSQLPPGLGMPGPGAGAQQPPEGEAMTLEEIERQMARGRRT